ncbi:oligosaccharide repeat unit polymerase [Aeromonas veronii]|uniref:oligosaccharide repeat unit polymerase n=1 Tax=Aeromonas TaxID=642 RepID=UPI000F784BF6|nr:MULTISPECIES: oligosaccharide repeat unit polymerase [Aeromonas]MBL0629255.1 oligosaccharide repeat unit polymerase [Aeromonas veronii]
MNSLSKDYSRNDNLNPFVVFSISTIVFLYIFPFTVMGVSTQFLVLILSVFSINRFVSSHIIIFLLTLIYLLLMSLYFGGVNYSIALILKVVLSYFLCKFVLIYIRDFKSLFKIIIYACLIHISIILFQMLSPYFRELWFNYAIDQSEVLFTLEERLISPFRNYGVSGYLFADQSVIFSFAFCLLILSKKYFNCFSFFIYAVCLLFGVLISGRSGLFFICTFIILLFLKSNIIDKLRISLSVVVFCGISVYVIQLYSPIMFEWAFEPFINLLEGKQLSKSSADTFSTHWYWLNTINENIFGTGVFSLNRDDYINIGYLPSDSIYMRLLVSGGLLQVTIFIAIYIFFTLKSIANIKKKIEIDKLHFIISFYLFVFAFSFKSYFIYSNFTWLMIFFFLCFKKLDVTYHE